MSKIVKGVGRAIGSVVKGAVKVVKSVAKSPLGRLAVGAALMYFGVPAVSGFLSAAPGAGLAGAMNGITGAWSGLTGAASSALAGNFAQAGSQLAGGFSGSGLIGSAASAPAGAYTTAAADSAALGTSGAAMAPAGVDLGAAGGVMPTAASSAAPGAGGPFGAFAKNPYVAPALINSASQVVGGLGQGMQMQAQQDHQDKLDAEGRARYSANVGANLFGPAPGVQPNPINNPYPSQPRPAGA